MEKLLTRKEAAKLLAQKRGGNTARADGDLSLLLPLALTSDGDVQEASGQHQEAQN